MHTQNKYKIIIDAALQGNITTIFDVFSALSMSKMVVFSFMKKFKITMFMNIYQIQIFSD